MAPLSSYTLFDTGGTQFYFKEIYLFIIYLTIKTMDVKSTINMLTCKNGETNIGTAQRIASFGGGAVLLFSALNSIKKPSLTTVLNAVAGGVMIYRGVTGYCSITNAISKK